MSFAPWRSSLAQALDLNQNLAYSRYLQLATVQANGRPANRTIVFRGFLDNTNQLKFVTDSRSQKFSQIHHQPWGEACWYFPTTREQFRISGELILVENSSDEKLQKARQLSWQSLSDGARLQFSWPNPRENRSDVIEFSPPPPNAVEPIANFCLLLLEPIEVDHLELRGEPQNRRIYRRENSQLWSTQTVNP